MHRFLCTPSCRLATLLGLLSLVAPAVAQDGLFRLDEVRQGQRGYGLSVFSGAEPERFEVEVIGVWENVRSWGREPHLVSL